MDDDGPSTPRRPDLRTLFADAPGPLRVAIVLIALESIALLAAGVFVVIDTLIGSPKDIALALLAALFAVGAGLGLAFAARGLARLESAVRSPVVVVQLLALPVSYSLGFESGRIGYGAPILICALAVLFLLFTPPVREVLDREPPR